MDDEELQIDSPLEEVVDDIEDDSDLEHQNHNNQSSSRNLRHDPRRRKGERETPRELQLDYPKSLPYECESLEDMDSRLDVIAQRLVDCVKTKDFDVGFSQWNHKLECWLALKYPMKRPVRAALAKLYYELSVTPGMEPRMVKLFASMAMVLLESKRRIDIHDLQLDWNPLYEILEKELFPKARKVGLTSIAGTLLNLAEYAQRFFPPSSSLAVLSTLLPKFDGSSLDSILATQSFLVHLLPLSQPQHYLKAVFELWQGFHSSMWDNQWLDLVSRLAEKHLDPDVSSKRVELKLKKEEEDRKAKRDGGGNLGVGVEEKARANGAGAGEMDVDDAEEDHPSTDGDDDDWQGIRKDVGIFSQEEWDFMMSKCLSYSSVPVGSRKSKASFRSGARVNGTTPDATANDTSVYMIRRTNPIVSFAILIISSMSHDSDSVSKTVTPALSSDNIPSLPRQDAIPDQPPPAGPKVKTYLAGSKALESLAQLIQATEVYFHPSNHGGWSQILAQFLQHLSSAFLTRWREEEKKECKTPLKWRLTPEIRKEFVLTLKTVALLSMFSKDALVGAAAVATLRNLAYLEPELIIPAVLERTYPSLEATLETHRTTACIRAVSALAIPLLSRSLFPAGGKHLIPLLDLCIPGIDVNDPAKTMNTALFILHGFSVIKVDDLTQADTGDIFDYEGGAVASTAGDGVDGEGKEISEAIKEENRLLRESTASFPDWVDRFFRQILALFDALPERGRGNRTGGKAEEGMTTFVLSACDIVCSSLSDRLFDLAFGIFFDYVSTTVRSNSINVVDHLCLCFARANPAKVLAKIVPLTVKRVTKELEYGACSIRTTSTSPTDDTDLTFSWFAGLLYAAVKPAGKEVLPYKAELMDLMKLLSEKALSERGYAATGHLIGNLLQTLVTIYPRDARAYNPEEWMDPAFNKTSHLHWGRMYEAKDVKIDWHVPGQDEVDFAMDILRQVIKPAIQHLSKLVDPQNMQTAQDQVWKNDFCRFSDAVKSALYSIAGLIRLPPPAKRGQAVSDYGDEVPEFIEYSPACEAGIPIQDPSDPRLQEVLALRDEIGETMHTAVNRLKGSGAEDSIDVVKWAIRTIHALMIEYPLSKDEYNSASHVFAYARQSTKVTKNQKLFPRLVWVRRAQLYHLSRMRISSFYRKRSELDDKLVADMVELSCSNYTRIRKSAQRTLDAITSHFDGTKRLAVERLYAYLEPGTDPDRMKGALYVLKSKPFSNFCILDWRYGPAYVMKILNCQHQEKPSIQELVRVIAQDFLVRLAEPSSLRQAIESDELARAAGDLQGLTVSRTDSELLEEVAKKAKGRIGQQDAAYKEWIPRLLQFAEASSTHWRYKLIATRFLRQLIRRDQPLMSELASYMARQAISTIPDVRVYCLKALSQMMYFIKLRTLCRDEKTLLLQQAQNPLKRTMKLPRPLSPNFTQDFIDSFQQPLRPVASRSTQDAAAPTQVLLMDKQSTGWLVWGESIDYYEVPPEDVAAIEWDKASGDALNVVRQELLQQNWWDRFTRDLAKEDPRDYPSADNVTIVKSIFQVLGGEPLQIVLPIIESLLAQNDKDKQRAATELLGGILRGSKHWPLKTQAIVWDWLAPRLQKIFEEITPDTQNMWETFVAYVLCARDPRRNQPLVDWVTSQRLEGDTGQPFAQAKSHFLVGIAMKSLSWHFLPWAPRFLDQYWHAVDHPYSEVRDALATNLRHLSEVRLHPSFASTEEFLEECDKATGRDTALTRVDDEYVQRINGLVESLKKWRAERLPTSQGSQAYDRACQTILTWMWSGLTDFRITTMYPFVDALLYEIFRMLELLDNEELVSTAGNVLGALAVTQYPAAVVRRLTLSIISLLESSTSWRVRVDVQQFLQVFFFHQLYLIDDDLVENLMNKLCEMLEDSVIEVRESAATTLSGFVRCSQRKAVLSLKRRFLNVVKTVKIPKKRLVNGQEVPGWKDAIIKAHAAVLGATALIDAFPYDVPTWMPELLIETATRHITSPAPIKQRVERCLADFKKSHQDSWHEDQKAFTSDQLLSLNDLLIGSTYYA